MEPRGDLMGLITSIAALESNTVCVGPGSQSLSRALRPCDDIMRLIGAAVSKRRDRLTRHYHLRQYFNYVQLSAEGADSKLPWRPACHY